MAREHSNATISKRLWTAIADGDADAVRRLLADDVDWRSTGRNRLSGEYRGPDEVLEYLADIGDAADQLRSDLTEVYSNDAGAVVTYHVSARRGDKQLEMDYVLLLRVQNERIVSALVAATEQAENDAFWK